MKSVVRSWRASRTRAHVRAQVNDFRGSDAVLRTRGVAQYLRRGHAVRRATIERYLASTTSPRLHVGAGPHRIEGWLNADLVSGDIYLDLSRPLPFDDATFSYIFGEQVIEHLSERAAAAFMREAARVLRPGGVLRLTTPDLRKLISLYDGTSRLPWRTYAGWLSDRDTYTQPAQLFNDLMRLWGHRYIYDQSDLADRLLNAGFSSVERFEPGESHTEALRWIEQHGGGPEGGNQADSMSLEAVVSHQT